MLTGCEAAAISYLLTPKDFSLHKHIEVRIWDSIQHGGTHIIYAGELTDNVVKALEALGYTVIKMVSKEKTMVKICWRNDDA